MGDFLPGASEMISSPNQKLDRIFFMIFLLFLPVKPMEIAVFAFFLLQINLSDNDWAKYN